MKQKYAKAKKQQVKGYEPKLLEL